MWPVLIALRKLGGSATILEIDERVVHDEGFTEAQQQVLTKDQRTPQIQYRLRWARTHLKWIGAAVNSSRGVWALTEKGKTLSRDAMRQEVKKWRESHRFRDPVRDDSGASDAPDEDPDPTGWRGAVLAQMLDLPSEGFERLSQRILREAGFTNVTVTGRPGDGGIDGVGTYRLSLVSFPVYFQCKRIKGTVPARDIRDFRGAMTGRGEKGLFITTGTFTRDAENEATRDGAPPIDLAGGDRLCELMKEYGLGITVKQRIEEDISISPDFFREFR